ncbi:hypothetical protein ACG873_06560 [Mesorhizobium sp. AaZ16]|uniref:hypothetical protein n=1 Tax=Mesorhizobium sp. AaZ16 TaxID=3402289 RepID=UPI00374F7D82
MIELFTATSTPLMKRGSRTDQVWAAAPAGRSNEREKTCGSARGEARRQMVWQAHRPLHSVFAQHRLDYLIAGGWFRRRQAQNEDAGKHDQCLDQ